MADVNKELDQKKEQIDTMMSSQKLTVDDKALGVKFETKEVKEPTGEKVLGFDKMKTVQKKTGNIIMPHKSYGRLKANVAEFQSTKKLVENYMTTDLVLENKALKGNKLELIKSVNKNANLFDNLKVKTDKLREEIKSLKDRSNHSKTKLELSITQ